MASVSSKGESNPQVPVAPTIQVEISMPVESGIHVSYPGKLNVRSILGKLRPRSQRHLSQYSHGTPEEQSQNLVVEGENLQVMASLYRYRGQVDLVLADPPYNTGNDFRYNDKWIENPNDPDPGPLVASDDGAKHTKWMQFMAPRLEMMKAMLKPGGVCAICIDDRELFRLGMLMDETFGERNRIAIINWQKSYSPKSDSEHVSTATEYVLVYAKSKDKAVTELLDRTETMNARYTNPDNDPNGDWYAGDLSAKRHKNPEDYGIQSPFTGEIHYPNSGRWRLARLEMKRHLEQWGTKYVQMDDPNSTLKSLVLKGTKLVEGSSGANSAPRLETPEDIVKSAREKALEIQNNEVWPKVGFLKGGEGRPRVKRYLNDVKKGRVAMSYWADEDYDDPLFIGSQSWDHEESGHSQAGKTELTRIVGPNHNFETVKPLKLFTKIMQLWCPEGGIVLDPFAGSGTTGHAVFQMNHELEGQRRFILIEQSRPEKGDAYARTLLSDRLQRVLTGKWKSGKREPLEGGFTFKTSTTQVDSQAVLAMQREELVDLVLMSHWELKHRKGPMLTTLVHKSYKYLVAHDGANHGFFLVWNGPDQKSPLTQSVLKEIVREAEKEGFRPPYNIYARTTHVLDEDVIFWKIPQDILARIGFNDAFGTGESQ